MSNEVVVELTAKDIHGANLFPSVTNGSFLLSPFGKCLEQSRLKLQLTFVKFKDFQPKNGDE